MIGLVGINPESLSRTTMFQRKLPKDESPSGVEKGMGDHKIQKLRVGEASVGKLFYFPEHMRNIDERKRHNG